MSAARSNERASTLEREMFRGGHGRPCPYNYPSNSLRHSAPEMKRINRTRFLVGALVALVVIIALVLSKREGSEDSPPVHLSDSSPVGGRGLALVLQKLGYGTNNVDEPINAMPSDARVWCLLDSKTTFSSREADLLLSWVRGGGTLFYAVTTPPTSFGSSKPRAGVNKLSEALNVSSEGSPTFSSTGLPQMVPVSFGTVSNYRTGIKSATATGTALSVSRKHINVAGYGAFPGGVVVREDIGKGRVWLFSDAWMLSNYGLSQGDNATLVANLLRAHDAKAGGKAYFDERHHDDSLAPPAPDDWPARLRQKPVVFALWQLMVVGLGTLALVGRRLGNPVALSTQAPVTRASGFARAMGGLLLKAGRPKAASQIIGESFRARLARRVGLSPRESDEVLSNRAHEISGIPRETLSRALIASRAPATDETSALRDAQAMERILEGLG